MPVLKVERHCDSLFYSTVTEMNRFACPIQQKAVQAAREYAKQMSKQMPAKSGRNQFFVISIYNERLREWSWIATYKNGYEE